MKGVSCRINEVTMLTYTRCPKQVFPSFFHSSAPSFSSPTLKLELFKMHNKPAQYKVQLLISPPATSCWCVCVCVQHRGGCSLSALYLSKARHELCLIQIQIPFVGTDSEVVNVSWNTHMHKCTRVQLPEGLFPLIWILLSHHQCSRCEAAVRCVCICVIGHMALWLPTTHLIHLMQPLEQVSLCKTLTLALSPVSKAAAVFRKHSDWWAHNQGQIAAIARVAIHQSGACRWMQSAAEPIGGGREG